MVTEYLDIDSISDYTKDTFFYPTFGPCNIDLYSEPDNQRIKSKTVNGSNVDLINLDNNNELKPVKQNDLPRNLNRSYVPVNGSSPGGGDYVARLLLGINSTKLENFKNKDEITQIVQINDQVMDQIKKDFVVFVMLSEVTMIDPKYHDNISFQLCIGNL